MRLVLTAKRAADIRGDDAHHALSQAEGSGNLHPIPMGGLAGRPNGNDTLIIDPGDPAFCLEKCMLGPLCAVGVFDNDISGCKRRFHITAGICHLHHDIALTGYDLIGTGLHRLQWVKNTA